MQHYESDQEIQGGLEKGLTLDIAKATGGNFALELLQATIFVPSTVEAAQAMTDAIHEQWKEAQ
jgi:hypothetical protein